MGFLLLLHVLLLAAAARAPAAQAWGEEGHYMTCKIAEGLLTSEASAAVKGLLPGWANGELAEACSWPDAERRRIPWFSPLHFADTPGDCKFSYARDCHGPKGEKDMCVVGLLQVWDEKVIETAMNRFYKDDLSTMIQAIQLNLTNEWSKEEYQWAACYTRTTTCGDKYAEESAELSCPAYVGADQGSNLEDEYFFKALPVVQKRIAQGGVRLAAILNRIFSGKYNIRLESS